jgi:vacuolar-type H+-ATPase subunit D/Vma8
VAFIISTLEEREREETFRLKLLKTRATKADKKRSEEEKPEPA